jgi:hypothetical protein
MKISANLFICVSLIACKSKAPKALVLVDKELYTLYQKEDKKVNVANARITSNNKIILSYYTVDINKPEQAQQAFIRDSVVQATDLEKIRSNLISLGFNWMPFKGDNVVLVQLQPKSKKNTEFDLLNQKSAIEDLISDKLTNLNIGEWMASDIGPGGANILYTVTNFDSAFSAIVSVLHGSKIERQSVIARRVMVTSDDWFYEVVYPSKFQGTFNSM